MIISSNSILASHSKETHLCTRSAPFLVRSLRFDKINVNLFRHQNVDKVAGSPPEMVHIKSHVFLTPTAHERIRLTWNSIFYFTKLLRTTWYIWMNSSAYGESARNVQHGLAQKCSATCQAQWQMPCLSKYPYPTVKIVRRTPLVFTYFQVWHPPNY